MLAPTVLKLSDGPRDARLALGWLPNQLWTLTALLTEAAPAGVVGHGQWTDLIPVEPDHRICEVHNADVNWGIDGKVVPLGAALKESHDESWLVGGGLPTMREQGCDPLDQRSPIQSCHRPP